MIEKVEKEIKQALSRMQSGHEGHKPILNNLKSILKDMASLNQLKSTQKELNVALSKYPKLLDKSFIPDISKAYRNIDFETQIINQIIASHFYREGKFNIADCFVEESCQPKAAAHKSPFLEMFGILEAMRSRNLSPALTWAAAHQEELMENGSDIELNLHQLQFVETLQKKGRDEALMYARTFLAQFSIRHMSEIQKLVACLLWSDQLDQSPYPELISSVHWDRLADELVRQFCNLIGQSYESPMGVTVASGTQALPGCQPS